MQKTRVPSYACKSDIKYADPVTWKLKCTLHKDMLAFEHFVFGCS